MLPVTTGERTVGSNRVTPQRNSGAGITANARLSARIAGCWRPTTTIGEVGGDPRRALIDAQLRIQADTDVAVVVVRLACNGFRHRHLGAQRRRIVTHLAQMRRQCRGHRAQHADRHGRTWPGGRGAGSGCARCAFPPVGSWFAAPDATAPAVAPGPLRCRGPADDAHVPRRGRATAAVTPRSRGVVTGAISYARPNSRAASADDLTPSAKACDICTTATVAGPETPGTPSTGVNTTSRHGHTRASSWSSASPPTAARQPAQLLSSSSCTESWSASTGPLTQDG